MFPFKLDRCASPALIENLPCSFHARTKLKCGVPFAAADRWVFEYYRRRSMESAGLYSLNKEGEWDMATFLAFQRAKDTSWTYTAPLTESSSRELIYQVSHFRRPNYCAYVNIQDVGSLCGYPWQVQVSQISEVPVKSVAYTVRRRTCLSGPIEQRIDHLSCTDNGRLRMIVVLGPLLHHRRYMAFIEAFKQLDR